MVKVIATSLINHEMKWSEVPENLKPAVEKELDARGYKVSETGEVIRK